ncbi:unnamed protein product [Hymenolepis diminuta]|uniref:Cell wall surface anchor family protein n=1 Tax=Hymenolepis diminuta TaxID=6216 RepID=A0A0R3SLI1_HYMDI|nr:unnamed protein product [Hymenolepis diminuta]
MNAEGSPASFHDSDLQVMAFSYAGMLRPMKETWVTEAQIHLKEQKPEPVAISVRNPVSAAGISQQQSQAQTITSSSSANAASSISQATTKSSSQVVESAPTSTATTGTTSKSAGNTPTASKTTKTPVTTSAQKRVASFESGTSPSIEHVSSDELREGKHRRAAPDRAHSAKVS